MKKLVAVLFGCLLAVNFAAAGELGAADQKWLEVVQQMVAKGETRVSTPSEVRVNLLKEWAGKEGYSIQATKTETGYTLQLSRSFARK